MRTLLKLYFPASDLPEAGKSPPKRLPLALSGGTLLLLLAVLWAELSAKEHLGALWQTFLQHLLRANPGWFAGALLLVPLNWLAETRKWHTFIRQFEPMPLWKALLAVWVGVCFSLFTPNRVGEYGGRLLFVRPEHRWKAVMANVVGNYGQLLVILSAGMAGAWVYAGQNWVGCEWFGTAAWMLAPVMAALLLLYFHLGRLPAWSNRIKLPRFLQPVLKEAAAMACFNRRELAGILGWAAARYFIYATQYFLLLRFLGINAGFTDAYAAIATIFLVQTSLPLPPLAGLVARGNIAVQVWSVFGANEIASLAATFTLWIINLILPALIGTFSLFYVNIGKQPAHEDD